MEVNNRLKKGDIIRNPQSFAGYSKTFLSFSGHAGDLVSVRYTTNRVPKNREEFNVKMVTQVPITPSGQLCIDIEMPTPVTNPQYGVLLFEAENPTDGKLTWFCTDVKVKDVEARGEDHPAMCARNNETLIPMPDEFL
ncbi:hypothetical protein CVT25_013267 [Psilocybe cyanescens]|uniref:Chitin-binding type-4 domain-containing protein n=1 Tax=Psilocybe cyanescens TaxID=93625 RepID=A0A409XK60_PSICY|nr:hypothetical protein CVT25_013267 [Psilocybe cyanescens]